MVGASAQSVFKRHPCIRSGPAFVQLSLLLDPQMKNTLTVAGLALTVAGLAQSVERLTAEREVAGSNPGAGPLLRVLK